MGRMETNFYVVGENRGLAFLLKNFKFILWFLILIIAGLSATIAYLHFMRLQDQEQFKRQIKQEKIRSDGLISKLKQTGQQDSEWEQQVLSQSSKQKKLNEQQASLIERQGRELSEMRSILEQREQVVQQFQLEKTSTQEQINNLQLKVRSLQEQITELETAIRKQEQQKKKHEQKSSPTVAAVKKQKSQSTVKPTATVEKLKIRTKGSQVSVSYNLTNQSNTLQRGRTGMYLSSKTNLEKSIPYSKKTSIAYKIKRYRVISRYFTKVKPGSFVRILIWNEKKKLMFDEAYPIK